jgi:hypothetical protein
VKTRVLFRAHGAAIPTRSSRTWLWQLLAVLAVVLLTAWGSHIDVQADMQQAELQAAYASGYDAGRMAGHHDMLARARAAWQGGLDEGATRCARGAR